MKISKCEIGIIIIILLLLLTSMSYSYYEKSSEKSSDTIISSYALEQNSVYTNSVKVSKHSFETEIAYCLSLENGENVSISKSQFVKINNINSENLQIISKNPNNIIKVKVYYYEKSGKVTEIIDSNSNIIE